MADLTAALVFAEFDMESSVPCLAHVLHITIIMIICEGLEFGVACYPVPNSLQHQITGQAATPNA